jgi:hypothetical protein
MWGYVCTLQISNGYGSYYWMLTELENRRTHQAFLARLAPQNLAPNPLPILMRAVNALLMRGKSFMVRRLPCWSARRWKSLT